MVLARGGQFEDLRWSRRYCIGMICSIVVVLDRSMFDVITAARGTAVESSYHQVNMTVRMLSLWW